jgi:hypothetical protein
MKKYFRTKNLLSEFTLNPKFIEVHDCVLLDDVATKLLPKSPLSPDERHRTEYLLNPRDIWELFTVPPQDPSPRLLCGAGNASREMWDNKLKVDFPVRRSIVYFECAPPICDISFLHAPDWHIEAEDEAKADWNSRRGDWRPRLLRSPLLAPKKGPE